jgi:hypothetical protein
MKIIHTYIQTGNSGPLTKNLFYLMSLSLLLAKRHYGYVVLYTNKEVGDIVKKIGLPYDEINTELLEGVNVKTFSIPKLIVYSNQNEPYIHIDLDTFIFKKLFFNDFENIYSTFPEGSGDILNFEKSNTSFYTTYVKRSFELQSKLPEEFLKYVKFNNVPNMSVFGGHNHELIKEASDYCLKLYYDNREFFDSNYYNACIIEQLFIPAAMRMLKNDHNLNNFKFIFDFNPTYIEFTPGKDWDFPFGFRFNDDLVMVDDYHNLFKRVMFDFNGFLHLNGYKNFEEVIFLIKERIIEDFNGLNYITIIDNMFPKQTKSDEISLMYYKYLLSLTNRLNGLLMKPK